MGFTRIYSGSLSRGQKLTVIGPKYDPSLPRDHQTNFEQITNEVEIKDLFLIMGRELVRMEKSLRVILLGLLDWITPCLRMPQFAHRYLKINHTLI